ncbi:hypothetical protein F7725_014988, partial [Dissostichus mawsoni]
MSPPRTDVAADKTKRKKRRELSEDQKHESKKRGDACALGFEVKKVDVLKILKDYDREGNGKITLEDFNEVEEVLKAFKLFDDDESGKISLRNLRR